jgi:Family of unknown function (DUF6221)
MDDLIAFAAARLDEDEVMAEAALEVASSDRELAQQAGPCVSDATYAHIERHGPARALREAEADRRLLRAYEESAEGSIVRDVLGFAVSVRAAIWDDNPDYRAEWKP